MNWNRDKAGSSEKSEIPEKSKNIEKARINRTNLEEKAASGPSKMPPKKRHRRANKCLDYH